MLTKDQRTVVPVLYTNDQNSENTSHFWQILPFSHSPLFSLPFFPISPLQFPPPQFYLFFDITEKIIVWWWGNVSFRPPPSWLRLCLSPLLWKRRNINWLRYQKISRKWCVRTKKVNKNVKKRQKTL